MNLFDILACTRCHGRIRRRRGNFISCTRCGRQFPLAAGVPVMADHAGDPNVEHEKELATWTGYVGLVR